MNYSKDERIEIGKKIYESGMSNLQADNELGMQEGIDSGTDEIKD